MEKKIMRRKTLVGVFLFVAIFSTLCALASIYDLQVSQILTKGHLTQGSYYANQDFFFGLVLEAFGSFPIWLAIATFGAILYCNAMNRTLFSYKKEVSVGKDNAFTIIAAFVGIVAVVGSIYFLTADTFKYFLKYAYNKPVAKTSAYFGVNILLSAIISPLFVKSFASLDKDMIKSLKTIAWIIVIALVTRIFIEGIKLPIGRMRFRAMNSLNNVADPFSYFTPWYVMNGGRELTDIFTVAELGSIPTWEYADACRSFPSGHTFAAGMSYVIICLPDIIKKWDNVVGRFMCWLVPIVITGLVAISRIMVGAHYFSDVLFGGTIVFLGVMIGREIFICKGSHFKCFMKDKK